MTVDSKESALSRWSRRKLEARRQSDEAAPQPVTEARDELPAAVDNPPEPAAENDRPILTDADMPDIESLDVNSDFSPFMSPGVSDKLRNLALRKLFRSSVFNIRDGLDEYDDDFTSFEKLGDVVTCDMKHRIEMEQQKLREALAGQEAPADGESVDDEALRAGGETQDDPESAAEDAAADEMDGVQIARADPGAQAEVSDDER